VIICMLSLENMVHWLKCASNETAYFSFTCGNKIKSVLSITLQFLWILAAYIDQSFSLWSRCKTGKHTAVKQVIAPVKKNTTPPPTAVSSTNASSKDTCSRCRQGFFCSDHGIHMLLLMPLSQVLRLVVFQQSPHVVLSKS